MDTPLGGSGDDDLDCTGARRIREADCPPERVPDRARRRAVCVGPETSGAAPLPRDGNCGRILHATRTAVPGLGKWAAALLVAALGYLGLNAMNRSIAVLLATLVAAWSVPVHAGDIGTAALRPVTVIDREDIALSGQRTLLELLQLRAPTNHFGLGRLLVADRTRMVLLIDGRRAGPLPDLDTIPLSMVERIEILDDSAVGPLAGHATSGAVNVVLREDLEGIEAEAGVIQPSEEGAQSPSGSVLWRGPVGRGRLTVGVDSLRRSEIRLADRDYGRSSWREGGSFAQAIGVSPSGNTVMDRACERNGLLT